MILGSCEKNICLSLASEVIRPKNTDAVGRTTTGSLSLSLDEDINFDCFHAGAPRRLLTLPAIVIANSNKFLPAVVAAALT